MTDTAFNQAFAEQNRRDQISSARVGSILSLSIMPAGAIMDYFVYEEHVWAFLALRILSSCIVALMWLFFRTPLGSQYHRLFGVVWYMTPAILIEVMIYTANSP